MNEAQRASPFGESADTSTGQRDVPIAQLDTTTPPSSSIAITAIVALIFPYSSHTRTAALLLVDPDMRQRSRKGQVRVQFHGAAAVAFAGAHIGSGDKIRLCLEGARWVEEDVSAVHTPGRSVDKELAFERRVVLSAFRDGHVHASLNVDAPASIPAEVSSDEREQDSGSSVSGEGSFVAITPSVARAQSRMNLGFDAFDNVDVMAPIVFDDAGYDPFLDDGGSSPRKRTKLGRKSGEWKLVGWDDGGRESPSKSIAENETLHPLEQSASLSSPSRTISRRLDSVVVDPPSAAAPSWEARLEDFVVEQPTVPSSPLLLATSVPDSMFVDLISPETDYELPPQTGGHLTFAADDEARLSRSISSLPVLRASQFSGPVSESLESGSDQQARQGLTDNKTSPHDSDLSRTTPNPFTAGASDALIVSSPPHTHSTSEYAKGYSLGQGETSASEETAGNFATSSAAASASQQDFRATPSLVEPLFGPWVPTLAINERHEALQDEDFYTTNLEDQLPTKEHGGPQPIVNNDDKDTTPSHKQEQVIRIASEISQNDSTAPEHQGYAKLGQSLPTLDLLPAELPKSSTDPVSPNTSAENLLTPLEIPDEPPLRPVSSSELPVVSPLPTSSATTYELPQSTTQTNISGGAVSTPLTSQIDNQFQASHTRSDEEAKVNSPSASIIEDPGAPPDTTMMPDDWTRAVDFGIEHVSSPIHPPSINQDAENAQVSPLDQSYLGGLGQPDRQLSQTAKDLYDGNEPQTTPILHNSKPGVALGDDNQRQTNTIYDVAQPQHVAEKPEATAQLEQHDDLDASDIKSRGAERNEPNFTREELYTPTLSRRDSRHYTVPKALSTFFQAMPPRRSHRHREPTEKVRQELQDKEEPEQKLENNSRKPDEAVLDDAPPIPENQSGDRAGAIISAPQPMSQPNSVKERFSQPSNDHEKSNGTTDNKGTAIDVPRKDHIALVHSRLGGFRTPLSYYAALKNVDVYLNASSSDSQGPSIDVFAVVTSENTPIERAKSGPKHHFTVLNLTDASLTNQAIKLECFRPHKSALPITHVGDIMLLREPVVRSSDGRVYLLSGGSSAWRVWHFCGSDNSTSPSQECRGPPVEVGAEEQAHAQALREWWLTVRDSWQDTSRSTPRTRKKSVSHPSGGKMGSPDIHKKHKQVQSNTNTSQADVTKSIGRGRKGHRYSKSRS